MGTFKGWTMRAGRGDETVAGYVIAANGTMEWLGEISQSGAFAIVRKRGAVDWCRAYTVENGQRVVLA